MEHLTSFVSLSFLQRLALWLTFVWLLDAGPVFAQPNYDQMYGSGPLAGIIIQPLSTQADELYDLKIDNSGRSVCVGRTYDDPDESYSYRIVVVRRMPDGSLDQSFDGTGNGNGIVYIDRAGTSDEAFALEIQSDNKIVLVGKSGSYPFAARLNENGTFDAGFGNGGMVVLDGANGNIVGGFRDLVIQPDGKIVAVGVVFTGVSGNDEDYLAVRLNTNGQRDNLFDFDGIASYSVFDDDYPAALSVRMQGDKFVICGRSNRDGVTTDDATLARLTSSGQLDSGFGKWASYLVGDDAAEDLLVLPTGKILTCGWERSSSDYYITLRLFSQSGTLESKWLYYALGEDDDRGYSLALQCDGKVLVLGQGNGQTIMLRLNADMSLDPTFGVNGFATSQIAYYDYPRAIRTDGSKIYLAGYALPNSSNFSNTDLLTARLDNTPFAAAPNVTPSGSVGICSGESVTLTATGVPAGVQPVWSNGQTGNSIVVSTSGNYSCTYQTNCGASGLSNVVTVTVTASPGAPNISAAGPVVLCPGKTVVLNASNIAPGGQVIWSNGMSGNSITVSAPGAYTARVKTGNCTSQPSNAIVVSSSDAPPAPLVTASGTVLCPNATVTLAITNPSNGSATWSNGQSGFTLPVSVPGSYTATMTNSNGCTSQPSTPVIITSLPLPATPSVSINGPAAVCAGQTTTLIATNICPGCTIMWSNGASGNSITVGPGAYTATASNLCGFSQASAAVTVAQAPPFVPVVTISDTCMLLAPSGGSNYQWYAVGSSGNTPVPGANSASYQVLQAGYYAVGMTSANGCSGVSNSVFATSCTSSSREPGLFSDVAVYPNPASETIFFEIGTLADFRASIEVFSADGRFSDRLWQGMLSGSGQLIRQSVEQLPAGLYFYRITGEKDVYAGSFMINR